MDEESVVEEAEAEISVDDELGAIFDAANAEESQPRDETGKFTAVEAETDAPTEAASEEITADPGAETEGEAETPALAAPASWTAEAAANWPSLTPDLQAEILRREGDWQKADSERATQLKGYEPIAAALEPVRQNLELNGVEPAQYVRQLVAADEYLRTSPAEAVQWIAQQYGVSPEQIFTAGNEIDPHIAPLVQEINQLRTQQLAFQQQQRALETERLDGEIAAFAADHKHFEAVREDMGGMIATGRASGMQDAYDRAVWANPVTRAAMQAETSVAAEEQRKAAAAEKAALAAEVRSTNLSTRGTAGGSTPPLYNNVDEELGDVFDRVNGA